MRDLILKQELWNNARLITTNIEAVFRPIVEKSGITLMQSRILTSIMNCDNPTVGNISKTIDVSCGNLSNMCKRLEKEGYIIRKRSHKDERVVELNLTDKGNYTLEKIEQELSIKYKQVIEKKSAEDFETIILGMKKLNELLTELESSN